MQAALGLHCLLLPFSPPQPQLYNMHHRNLLHAFYFSRYNNLILSGKINKFSSRQLCSYHKRETLRLPKRIGIPQGNLIIFKILSSSSNLKITWVYKTGLKKFKSFPWSWCKFNFNLLHIVLLACPNTCFFPQIPSKMSMSFFLGQMFAGQSKTFSTLSMSLYWDPWHNKFDNIMCVLVKTGVT